MNEYGDNDRPSGTVPRLPTPYEWEQHRRTCREFWRDLAEAGLLIALLAVAALLLGGV